ncbi:MAG: ABC transporter permease [Sphingobacteriaceae bacterium]|nr:ABC transporter permease [Cytophagaceae bacterium]
MNLLKISWANLRDRSLSSFLSGLLMALGVTIISLLLILNQQLSEQFTKNVRGVDLVIGAKGSPLQLILASIYHIDAPTGNIPLAEATRLTRSPLIKSAIPLALGDNYKGYRIVGTNAKYLDQYGAKVSEGRVFNQALEAVVGEKVARLTGLKISDEFVGSHGLTAGEGEEHNDKKYKVVGLLAPSNSVADQLIMTPVESVWELHEEEAGIARPARNSMMPMMAAPEPGKSDSASADDPSQEITALLVKVRSPLAKLTLPRAINDNSKLMAASPAIEINRLFEMLGLGIKTFQYIALAIIIISGISVFVSLYNSLKERRYEMALMLSMGATRAKLFGLLLLEGLMISLIGFGAGILLSRLGLFLLGQNVQENFHYDLSALTLLPEEGLLLLGTLAIGLLAAALPSLGIYRINISQTLADE